MAIELGNNNRVYKVEQVEEVHSGDDLVLMVNLGVDNLYKRVRARLFGIDTPDAYKADSTTEAGKVRDWVKNLVLGKSCHVELHSFKKGGWIVTLFVTEPGREPVNVNKLLHESGFVFNRGIQGRDNEHTSTPEDTSTGQ